MRDRVSTTFLIAVLAVLTFVPLLHSFYTTADDVDFALGIGREGWRSPWIFDALRTGRLQHLLDGQLMVMAYGWGSYWLAKALGIAAIVSNVAALFVLLRFLTGDSRFGVLVVVFFFAFIQNTWDHNLLTAYPFILHLSLTELLCALAMWWLALQRSQPSAGPSAGGWSVKRLTTVSLILFGISLFSYESFIIYGLFFPAMTLAVANGPWRTRVVRALRTPHLAVLLVFVVAVVLFRVVLMTGEGKAVNAAQQYEINLSPWAVWKVLERYGTSALPMHYFKVYRDLINDFYLGDGTFKGRLFDVFRIIDAAWLVKAAIVAFLVWTVTAWRTPVRRRGLLLLFGVVFMMLSSLPLAVTAKYQAWVIQSYSHAYLTSYFVFFGVVVLLALLFDSLVGLAGRWGARWSRVAAGALATAAFVISYGTDFQNAHVAASQRQVYDRWETVDAWLASPSFRELPDQSVVFAPSLWDRYPGATMVFDEYWTRYFSPCYITQPPCTPPPGMKRVNVVHLVAEDSIQGGVSTAKLVRDAEAAGRLYYLKVVRGPRDDLSYIAFGRVESAFGHGEPIGSHEVTLMSRARSEHLRVVGYVHGVTEGCRARVYVDGVPSNGTFESMFGVHVDRRRAPEKWIVTRLTTSSGLIDPETIMAEASSEIIDGAVDVRFGKGFFPDEVAHRWAENTAQLTLLNRTDRPAQVDFQFEIRTPWAAAGSSHRLKVTAGDAKFDWPIGEKFEKRTIPVALPPRTALDIVFSTDAPRIDPERDGRNLVMMFLPTIRAKEAGCEGDRAGH